MISMQIVQFWPLFHLPLSDLRLDQYSSNRGEITSLFGQYSRVFNSDSTNISPTANLRAEGERGA